VDPRTDIIERMGFQPIVREVRKMALE
jgi:hypothetical protein